MSRDVVKQELLAKLKQEHCFWSYNENSIKDIPDDMLIEKTLLHLDLGHYKIFCVNGKYGGTIKYFV